jgi:hypothetical protein
MPSRVFDITKRKFHNVLQGVAPKDTMLKEEDKKLFESWTEWNFKTYWSGVDGPLAADIIVIDDPQRQYFLRVKHVQADFWNSHCADSNHQTLLPTHQDRL